MYKKIIFISILSILFFQLTPTFAISYSVCTDANTLEINTTISVDGVTTNISEPKNCPYGCASNQCTPPATLNEVSSILLILLFAAMLIGGGVAENIFIVGFSGMIGVVIGASLWIQGIMIGGTLINNTYTTGIGLMFVLSSIYIAYGAYVDYQLDKEKRTGYA